MRRLACWAIVADGEPTIRTPKDGSIRAVLGGTSNSVGSLPHNLRKVQDLRAVERRGGLAVVVCVIGGLAIVPLVGDGIGSDGSSIPAGDGVRVAGRIDVLAIAAIALVHVMSEDTLGSGGGSVSSKLLVPGKVRRRVVGTMQVMVVKHGILVACGCGSGRGDWRRAR